MLDKLLSKFIWQKKRPRVRLKTLLLPKFKGGLGMPNLKNYYWAAQLRILVNWINNDLDTGWVKIEQNSIPETPLRSIIFLGKAHWEKIKIRNIWVQNTLNVWDNVRKRGLVDRVQYQGLCL